MNVPIPVWIASPRPKWFRATSAGNAWWLFNRGWEKDLVRRVAKLLRPTDVLYDIGANQGLYTVGFAHRVRHVVAFEPMKKYRDQLESNLRMNRVTNVEVQPLALSKEKGPLTLEGEKVEATTLDDAARTFLPPTVLKIDIEGAEGPVLEGGRRLFESSPPRLVVLELHPTAITWFGYRPEDPKELLLGAGYEITHEARRGTQLHQIFLHNHRR